jgi:hypothetical protein
MSGACSTNDDCPLGACVLGVCKPNTVTISVGGQAATVTSTSFLNGNNVTIGFTAPGLGANTNIRFVNVSPGTGCNWLPGTAEKQMVDFFPDDGSKADFTAEPVVGPCGLTVDTVSPLKASFSGTLHSVVSNATYDVSLSFSAAQ